MSLTVNEALERHLVHKTRERSTYLYTTANRLLSIDPFPMQITCTQVCGSESLSNY